MTSIVYNNRSAPFALDYDKIVAHFFANNEPGFVLPVDPQFLFQNAAGTIPVTAPGDPVGLRLDISRMGGKSLAAFLAGQPELRSLAVTQVNGTPPNPINYDPLTGEGNYSRGNSVLDNGGVRFPPGSMPVGSYWVDVECLPGSTGDLAVRDGISLSSLRVFIVPPNTRVKGLVTTSAAGGPNFAAHANNTGGSFIIHSVKEIPGNHFIQTTDAARPTYQIDGNGKPCLVYDGSDDFMVSAANVDFSATDEVMAAAGLYKVSDAGAGCIAELGTNINTQAGTFALFGPNASGSANVTFASRGATIMASAAYTNSNVAAPIATVLSGRGKVSTNVANLRVNGVQRASSSVLQGAMNYINAPLYTGRRGGTTLPFNGRDYGLTVLGRLPTDAELAHVEAYYAKASGVTL